MGRCKGETIICKLFSHLFFNPFPYLLMCGHIPLDSLLEFRDINFFPLKLIQLSHLLSFAISFYFFPLFWNLSPATCIWSLWSRWMHNFLLEGLVACCAWLVVLSIITWLPWVTALQICGSRVE